MMVVVGVVGVSVGVGGTFEGFGGRGFVGGGGACGGDGVERGIGDGDSAAVSVLVWMLELTTCIRNETR